jgi:hypothetical protein
MGVIFKLPLSKGTYIDSISNKSANTINGNAKYIPSTKGWSLCDESGVVESGLIYENVPNYINTTLVVAFKSSTNSSYHNWWVPHLNLMCITDSNGERFQAYLTSSGVIYLFAHGTYETNATNWRDNQWHLLIATWDGTTRRLWIDNDEIPLSGASNVGTQAPNQLWIGDGPTTHGMNGELGFYAMVCDHVISEIEHNAIVKEYLQNIVVHETKLNCSLRKVSDLSSEVDGVLGDIDAISDDCADDDTGDWGVEDCTLTFDTDHYDVDYVANTQWLTKVFTWNGDKKYFVSFDIKDGTNTGVSVEVRNDPGTSASYTILSGTTNSSWQRISGVKSIDPTGGSMTHFRILNKMTGAGNFQIKNIVIRELAGLVAAYNMIPSKGTLVDISGEGNDGTIIGALSTKDGMAFDGDGQVDIGSTALDAVFTETGNYTISCRVKWNTFGTEKGIFNYATAGGNRHGIATTDNILSMSQWNGSSYIGASYDLVPELGKWHTVTGVYNNRTALLYFNGSLQSGTNVVGLSSRYKAIGRALNGMDGEIQDLKLYNYAFTPQQAKDYHNSFRKPVLIDSLVDAAVGNTELAEWENISGGGVVEEVVIEQGELVINGDFSTGDMTGWYQAGNATRTVDASSNSLVVDITGGGTYVIRNTNSFTKGKRYRVKFNLSNTNFGGTRGISVRPVGGSTMFSEVKTEGLNIFEVTSDVTGAIQFGNDGSYQTGDYFTLDNLSVVEIPDLPGQETGDKYWEQGTAGIRAIQSKQAYGTWEFDVYKGADVNEMRYHCISDTADLSITNGYNLVMEGSEILALQTRTAGGGVNKFITVASYFDINTDYRIKIARLKSEGVFLDIPTLQVSNMVNDDSAPYISFISKGQYGFTAISNGSGNQFAGTADEISFVNTKSYLVELDLCLNSGSLPTVYLASNLGSVSAKSNSVILVNGYNSFILTATETNIGVLSFKNASTLASYEISGLHIRQIYPADTFWVGIKGGDFVADPDAENGYVTVNTTGGSGTNPVTDSTHKTSEYFVTDLDAGDKFGMLETYNQVKQ